MPDAALGQEWVIEPRQYGALDRLRELWDYRRLWWYFASVTVAQQYKRTRLGWIWLLLRIVGPIGLNSLIFGGVLAAPSAGKPYFLFFVCGMMPWVIFERSLFIITRSVERNRRLITKIYFPRLILPAAALAPALVYLIVLLVVLVSTVIYFFYRDGVWYVTVGPRLLAAAGFLAGGLLFAGAVGLFTSVLQARFRDVRYGIRYLLSFWLIVTPVIYPLSHIPEKWRWVARLNPMTTVVEGFKWAVIDAGTVTMASLVTTGSLLVATLLAGVWFFNREEAGSIDKL